jgi:glutamine amidotransferase
MQVLMDESTEFGQTNGLGLVPGRVERIASQSPYGQRLRVPHIGWATLAPSGGTAAERWNGSALNAAEDPDEAVYFVHSYHCVPADPAHRIAHVDYDGLQVTAAIRRDNITGVQFHPERSGKAGQSILREFVRR